MGNTIYEKVKTAMLAIQRYPWEQGVCAQALFEAGETAGFIAMAHDAVLRQSPDGRFAAAVVSATGRCVAVTDPAASGEAVWRAYEHTGDEFYKNAAGSMLRYLLETAPRTDSGLICHNEISFFEGYSPLQIWVDSCYMLPPFLAVMGKYDKAQLQMDGYLDALYDPDTGLFFHIYDCGTKRFVRRKLWATGVGWVLLGIARMIFQTDFAMLHNLRDKYVRKGTEVLDNLLKFRLPSGMFHDVLDDPDSFEDATSAMMMATFVYRGVSEGWLDDGYLEYADVVWERIPARIDEFGIIRGVCGSPHFRTPGTSAEAQAAYIMMKAGRDRLAALRVGGTEGELDYAVR